MNEETCSHCRGTQYVFVYWLEKILLQNGVHMTDIPPAVFKEIPIEYLLYCHCNVLISRQKPSYIADDAFNCSECGGSTWRFTPTAEKAGYQWKKVALLPRQELKSLPCTFFERCPCGEDEQGHKPPEKRKILETLSDLLKIPKLILSPF